MANDITAWFSAGRSAGFGRVEAEVDHAGDGLGAAVGMRPLGSPVALVEPGRFRTGRAGRSVAGARDRECR